MEIIDGTANLAGLSILAVGNPPKGITPPDAASIGQFAEQMAALTVAIADPQWLAAELQIAGPVDSSAVPANVGEHSPAAALDELAEFITHLLNVGADSPPEAEQTPTSSVTTPSQESRPAETASVPDSATEIAPPPEACEKDGDSSGQTGEHILALLQSLIALVNPKPIGMPKTTPAENHAPVVPPAGLLPQLTAAVRQIAVEATSAVKPELPIDLLAPKASISKESAADDSGSAPVPTPVHTVLTSAVASLIVPPPPIAAVAVKSVDDGTRSDQHDLPSSPQVALPVSAAAPAAKPVRPVSASDIAAAGRPSVTPHDDALRTTTDNTDGDAASHTKPQVPADLDGATTSPRISTEAAVLSRVSAEPAVESDRPSPPVVHHRAVQEAVSVPTPTAAPTELQTVPPHDPARMVERLGRYIVEARDQGRLLAVQITPPDLGPLRIEVSAHHGQLTARLETASTVAQQLLQDHLPQLHEALQNLGASVERIDVVRAEPPARDRDGDRAHGVGASTDWSASSGQSSPDRKEESRRPTPSPRRSSTTKAPAPVAETGSLQELNIRI
jgi:flagellar hook-length control protein FliK